MTWLKGTHRPATDARQHAQSWWSSASSVTETGQYPPRCRV